MARKPVARQDKKRAADAVPGKPDAGRRSQAVVIVHGMGEQRPMSTLRSFVEAVWSRDPGLRREAGHPNANKTWITPDERAGSHELRRITTPYVNGIRTDFYELYWADVTRGTTRSRLVAWVLETSLAQAGRHSRRRQAPLHRHRRRDGAVCRRRFPGRARLVLEPVARRHHRGGRRRAVLVSRPVRRALFRRRRLLRPGNADNRRPAGRGARARPEAAARTVGRPALRPHRPRWPQPWLHPRL